MVVRYPIIKKLGISFIIPLIDNLLGDNAEFNSNKIINIFKGDDNDFSKAVCLNAAAGLIVMEKHNKFIDAYKITREYILSGKAFEHLRNLQNV